jgi:hypothetical protein
MVVDPHLSVDADSFPRREALKGYVKRLPPEPKGVPLCSMGSLKGLTE